VSADELLAVAEALAAGVGAVHDAGIIHRDIKPSNLLIVQDPEDTSANARAGDLIGLNERLVVGDLGLAKDLEASSGLTVGAGTSGFAAPEQLERAATVTPAVDVHAASAVMFWLIARQPPPDDQVWPSMPDAVERVLRQGLASDPDDRFGSMTEWGNAMSEALRQRDMPTARRPEWLRPAPLVLVVAGLALVAAVAAGVGYRVGAAANGSSSAVVADDVRIVEVNGSNVDLVVTGPAVAVAGEDVVLEASTTGAGEVVWIVPSGETTTGPTLQLTSLRVGTAVITAAVGVDDGPALVAEFELEITG
jgi:hypothetical protein